MRRAFMLRKLLLFLLVLVISTIAGSFAGTFVQNAFPAGNVFHNLFGVEKEIGIRTARLDLIIIEFTFGAVLKLNLIAVLFMIAAGYLSAPLIFRRKALPPGNIPPEAPRQNDENEKAGQ
jgi:hypothetical protein